MSALLYTTMALRYEKGDVVTPTRRRWSSESPPGNIYNTDHKGHPSRGVSGVFPRAMPRARTPPPDGQKGRLERRWLLLENGLFASKTHCAAKRLAAALRHQ